MQPTIFLHQFYPNKEEDKKPYSIKPFEPTLEPSVKRFEMDTNVGTIIISVIQTARLLIPVMTAVHHVKLDFYGLHYVYEYSLRQACFSASVNDQKVF